MNKQYPQLETRAPWPLVAVGVVTLTAAVWGINDQAHLSGAQAGAQDQYVARLLSAEPEVQPELPDFSAEPVVQERKDLFFDFMVPMIEEENERLKEKRQALLNWQARLQQGEELSEVAMRQINRMAEQYYVETDQSVRAMVDELVLKVDTLPPSLIVAQAANESAWGTSRFAREGNNLFGQWCFSSGCGIVPGSRPEGETYEVRSFASPAHSVRSFIQNLNRHASYEALRTARAEMREQNKDISGLDLAPHLLAYSTRREEYVEEIVAMINFNNLQDLDQ